MINGSQVERYDLFFLSKPANKINTKGNIEPLATGWLVEPL